MRPGVSLVPVLVTFFAIAAFLLLLNLAITKPKTSGNVNTTNTSTTKNANLVVCTDEAKLCPDGSAVGRTGPNCEFAACPDTARKGDDMVYCAQDIKTCADGSYVARQAPTCEFAACPTR